MLPPLEMTGKVIVDSAVKLLIGSLLPRKARVLQRTFEPGPSWRLYCTLRRLPFRARRWRRQATEVSCWERRRLRTCFPLRGKSRKAGKGVHLRRKPLMVSLPFPKGDVCAADRGILIGLRRSRGASTLHSLSSTLFLKTPS